MILLIDNYDSFVHNLARFFVRLGQPTRVVRNDQITIDQICELDVDAIVLSPGPCGPDEAGICLEVVKRFWQTTPILGVCLGHQVIAAAFGARVIPSNRPIHGRKSVITHSGAGIFKGTPETMSVGRYHALIVDPESNLDAFDVSATTSDGTIMAISHRDQPVYGVQFHPESILTTHGYQLLANFLDRCGLPYQAVPDFANELVRPAAKIEEWPERPVTF